MKTSQFVNPYFVKINFFLPFLFFFSLFDLETLEHYLEVLLLDYNLFNWCTNKDVMLRNLLTLKVYHVLFSFIPSAFEVFTRRKLALNELLEYSSNVKLSLVIIPHLSFLFQAIRAAVALKKCWLFRAVFTLGFRFIATLVKTGFR